jgi:hypothetical protein
MKYVEAISSVPSSVVPQTIVLLQAEMLRYAQAANSQSGDTSSDYRALQTAIKSGNLLDAQAALFRLRHDNQAGASNAATSASPAPAAGAPPVIPSLLAGNTGAVPSSDGSSLNATA